MFKKMGLIAGILALAITAEAGAKRAVVVFKAPKLSANSTEGIASVNVTALAESLKQNQIRVESTLPQINSVIVTVENEQEVEKIKKHPSVALVDVDVLLPAPKPVKGFINISQRRPGFNHLESVKTPWGIKAVRAEEAWGVSKRGQGTRVLVLDTGIDKDHPSLKDNYEGGKNFIPDNNGPYPEADYVGHGTHVAGTIAGMVGPGGFAGVAPEAKILMGRVCSDAGCSSVGIAEGINWGIEQKVDVISMSLGGAFSPPSVRLAVQRAESTGVVVVAASGNDGTGVVSYPAALPTVIAVGAVDPQIQRASFSQYGPELDVMAPGVEVVSTVPMGSGRESVITIKGETTVDIPNAPVQGAGDFTGSIEGELVPAGIGRPEDFQGLDLKGKVALIARGEITFVDKVMNAIKAGAIAALIYNNEPGLVRGGINPTEPVNMPVFIIEQQAGLDMKKDIESGKKVVASMAIEATDYSALDGTSMATPHVSGVVALLRATNKNLTPAQVREIIKKTAAPMSATNPLEVGAGLVDAASAVSAAKLVRVAPLR